MFQEEYRKPKTQLEDVYDSRNFNKNIKRWLEEIPTDKNIYKNFEGFAVATCSDVDMDRCMNKKIDNIEEMTSSGEMLEAPTGAYTFSRNTERLGSDSVPVNLNNAISVVQNDNRLALKIDNYTSNLKSSSLYDVIDDDGNLLMNNTDANPNIRDALLEDSNDLLIQENNIFIAGTFVAVSILFTFLLFK